MHTDRINGDASPVVNAPTGQGLSRREMLAMVGGGALASMVPACGRQPLSESGAATVQDPIHYSSARALATAIGNGDVSSEAAVQACVDRISAVNPQLNAVVQLVTERAVARAREADAALARGENWGPLHGVPMTIKDSLDTEGVITTGGTKGRASFVPAQDATVVNRLRNAGAILLGKTNTPELTLSFETDNLIYGRTNNPYDLSRTPGGSSGGAAAIVAAGGSPFDVGSDYGGSIRLPAHFCGICGIKPSAGRVPRTGHIYPFGGVQDSFQQIGPLARSVDDLTFLLPLIMGPDGIDPAINEMWWEDPSRVDLSALRVSFHADNGVATPTLETMRTVRSVAEGLAPQVARVVEDRPPGLEGVMQWGLALYFWDGGAAVRRLLRDAGTVETTLAGLTEQPAVSAEQLDQLLTQWYAWRSDMNTFMEQYDAIVCPVNAGPAHPHGLSFATDAFPAFSYTFTYNLAGWPGVVVRAGTSPEGLPIGVQIVTKPGREDIALALAKSVELTHGGYQRPPI